MAPDQIVRTLLIDDDEDEYVLVRALLGKATTLRSDLDWVQTYEDAIRAVRSKQHRVHLLDYRLGAASGLDLLRELVAGGCDEPIIFLTGQRDPDLDTAALQAGAADFLNKQELSAPLLERSIRYAIERSRRARLAAALREQQRIEQVRERLIGIVGHDLRGPLSAISTAGHLLLARPDAEPEAHARIAQRIVSTADRMARMIGELLDFTRGRLGAGIPIDPRPMDLTEVCRRTVEEVRFAHPEREIRFVADGEVGGCWDPERVAQVVSNLVSNAIAYGDAGTPVTVWTAVEADDAVLRVHNFGNPIPPDTIGRLFDPFRRGQGEQTESSSAGLGLGLYIVQQIASGHRGRVDVESNAASGTTFTVRLPIAAMADAGRALSAESSAR